MGVMVASVAALFVGPLVERLSRARREATALLDGFVLVAMLGMVGLLVLPHSLELGGVWAAAAAVVGFLIPPALERRLGNLADPLHGAMLWLAMAGLAVHSMLDGAAMVGEGHAGHAQGWLGWSVVLHNIPLGLAIWWAVRHSRGLGAALAVMGMVALATVAGFVGAAPLVRALPLTSLAAFEALVAGSLLHVVAGHEPAELGKAVRGMRRYAAVGALTAVSLLLVLGGEGHEGHEAHAGGLSATSTALGLALATAPALLAALVLASLVRGLSSPPPESWLLRGSALVRAAKGTVFRLRIPMCSSGALPSYRHLVSAGLPVAAAMATLVAMPGLGFDAILVTWPLLGPELTIVRVAAVAGLAMLVALIVGLRAPTPTPSETTEAPAEEPALDLLARLRAGFRFGFGDLLDHVGPWMVVAIAAASVAEPLLQASWLDGLGGVVGVVLMALAGLPGYVSASAATVVAAILVHKGLSPGAAVAFLLTAPATNATTLAVLRELHGRRTSTLFAVLTVALAAAVGLGVDRLAIGLSLPELHADASSWRPLQLFCLGAVGLALLASLWRQGPRAMAAQVFDPHDEHDHQHDHHHHGHEHNCGHDEGHAHHH